MEMDDPEAMSYYEDNEGNYNSNDVADDAKGDKQGRVLRYKAEVRDI